MPVIVAHGLYKAYAGFAPVLRGVDIEVERGELVAIMGPSGCGKSTMLHILGMLHFPDKGTLSILDTAVLELKREQVASFRRAHMGFVMQSNNLFEHSTVFENVEFPLIYERVAPAERWERVIRALDLVNLSSRVHYRSNRLSGGEQQRVAIARAMVNEPKILLADEPTGALDARTSRMIMENFRNLCHASGVAMVMVTHDPKMADFCDTVYTLEEGLLVCHKHNVPKLDLEGMVSLLEPPKPKLRGALISYQLPKPFGSELLAVARELYKEGYLARIYTLEASGLLSNPEGYSLPLAIRRFGHLKGLGHLFKFLSPKLWGNLSKLHLHPGNHFNQGLYAVLAGLIFADWCHKDEIQYLYATDAGPSAWAAFVCAQVCQIPFGFDLKSSDLVGRRLDLHTMLPKASFVRVGSTECERLLSSKWPDLTLKNVFNRLDPPTMLSLDDETKAEGDSDRVATLVAAGRIIKAKGYELILEAAKLLQNELQIIVKIAGTGPDLKRLKSLAKKYGGLHMVSFLGPLPPEHMDDFYQSADIFLAPAKAGLHDLPTALLEAMSMQLAVIVTDQPIFHEVVVEGRNGLFIPPDDPKALAAQIKRLASDRALTKKLGQQAQSDIQARFKRDKLATMIAKMMQEQAKSDLQAEVQVTKKAE